MFSKQKKWFSWLLVVTMLITIFPIHNLVFAAPGQNQSLADALDSVNKPSNSLFVDLSNKNISGEIDIEQIKAKFPSLKAVNLSGNLITKIDNQGSITINSANNLLQTNERALKQENLDLKTFKKYQPEDVVLYSVPGNGQYSKILLETKPSVSLEDLVKKELIEKIEYEVFDDTNVRVLNGSATNQTQMLDFKIPQADILGLNAGKTYTVKLAVYYKTFPNEKKEVITCSLNVVDYSLQVSGPDRMYENVEYSFIISKMDGLGSKVAITPAEINTNLDPTGVLNNISDFDVLPEQQGDDVVVKIKPHTGILGVVKFNFVSGVLSVTKNSEVVQINITDFQIEEENVQPLVSSLNPIQKPIYVLEGTQFSSMDLNIFNNGLANPSQGRYLVRVKENGQIRDMKPEEASLIDTTEQNGYKISVQEDNGKVYIMLSTPIQPPVNVTVDVKIRGFMNKIVLKPILQTRRPDRFYIYPFDSNIDASAINDEINDDSKKSPYVIEATNLGAQDGVASTALESGKFDVQEGSSKSKKFVIAAGYDVNGNEVRKRITDRKIWYQKEKSDIHFNTSAYKKIGPENNTNYNGAPLEAIVDVNDGDLIVRGIEKNPQLNEDSIADLTVAMNHYNPNGFWFKIRWIGKEVKNYVLVPQGSRLEYDLTDLDQKRQLILDMKAIDEDPSVNGFINRVDQIQKLNLPIGTQSQLLHVVAIYDNDTAKRVNTLNSSQMNFELPVEGLDTVPAEQDPAKKEIQHVIVSNDTLRFDATEEGGIGFDNNYGYVDLKVGFKGEFKAITPKHTKVLAEITLAPSIINGVEMYIKDRQRLTFDEKTLKSSMTPIVWKRTTEGVVYQGDASGNQKLQTAVAFIPKYTNKDLTLLNVKQKEKEANTPEDEIEEKSIQKFSFDANFFDNRAQTAGDKKAVSFTKRTKDFLVTTTLEDGQASLLPITVEYKWSKDPNQNALGRNPIKLVLNDLDSKFKVLDPIYDGVKALHEKADGTGTLLENQNTSLELDFGVSEMIHVKLTNSNLTLLKSLNLNDKFPKTKIHPQDVPPVTADGVYFYGLKEIDPVTGMLQDGKAADYNPGQIANHAKVGAPDGFANIGVMALASGQYLQAGKGPGDYATELLPNASPYSLASETPEDILMKEFEKLKPHVYKKNASGEYEVVDPSEVTITKNNIPGVFNVTASRKGSYKLVFGTEQDGVESPLLPIGEGYQAGKDIYQIDLLANRAKIQKLYHFIDNNNNNSVEVVNGQVKISEQEDNIVEFYIYPIVADEALVHLLRDRGWNNPLPNNFYSSEGKQVLTLLSGSLVEKDEDIKKDLILSDNGLSFMNERDFVGMPNIDLETTLNPNTLVDTSAEIDNNGNYRVKVIVRKGKISEGAVKVKFDVQDGDFNELQVGAIPQAPRLLKPSANFKPSDTNIPTNEFVTVARGEGSVIQDIIATSKSAAGPSTYPEAGIGERVEFEVRYLNNDNTRRNLKENEIANQPLNSNKKGWLEIVDENGQPVDNSGLQSINVVRKASPDGIEPATISFIGSKVGLYTVYLRTINEEGAQIPALNNNSSIYGQVVRFFVKPQMTVDYDLYHDQVVDIDIEAGGAQLEYQEEGTTVLDPDMLALGKLYIKERFEDPVTKDLRVKVFSVNNTQRHEVGVLRVTAHAKKFMTYEILPVTEPNHRKLVNDGDVFKVRARALYSDNSYEDLLVTKTTFVGGYNLSITEGLDAQDSFMQQNPGTDVITIERRGKSQDVSQEWLGDIQVEFVGIDGHPHDGMLYLQLTPNPIQYPDKNYELYRLYKKEGQTFLDKITKPVFLNTIGSPDENVYVYDSLSGSVVSDYILNVENTQNAVAYRRMHGVSLTTSTAATLDQIRTNPNNYARINISPLSGGSAVLTASDDRNQTSSNAQYVIIEGQKLKVDIVYPVSDSANKHVLSVEEGESATIVATVQGGVLQGNVMTRSLQWQESVDGGNSWTDIIGATSENLAITNPLLSDDGKQFKLNAVAGSDYAESKPVTLKVSQQQLPFVTGNILVNPRVVAEGDRVEFSTQFDNLMGRTVRSYKWISGTTLNDAFQNPELSRADVYQTTAVQTMNNKKFYVQVEISDGSIVNLGPAQVTVRPPGTVVDYVNVEFVIDANGKFNDATTSKIIRIEKNDYIRQSDIPKVIPDLGFEFKGWNPNPRGMRATTDLVFRGTCGPVTQKYRVIFNSKDNGRFEDGTTRKEFLVEKGSDISSKVPRVVANSGYTFVGWNPNANGYIVNSDTYFEAMYSSVGSGGGPGGGGGPAPTPQPIPQPQPQPTPQPQPERPKSPVLQLNKNFKGAYIAGYPDGTVRPSAQITRAEVSAIFARIMLEQMVDGKAYPSQFKDVAGGKWYSDYIGFLQDFSVLSGYPDGTFKPNNKITRAEFAVIVSKFFELKTTNNKFADVKENHWAKKYIDAAVANALMGGYPDGTFKPDQPITRAEVVTVINKALERKPNKADIDANPANAKRFKDLKPSHWAYYDMIEASTDHTR